uniref:SAP domain-containing ribonucleoprotein n=1 Tax=Neogobius melanostomus TaxID=47308 RepID=A0A8C6S6P4_9GOBI
MAEVIELQKLKLAELRQECEARGLETKGNKGELIARLQAYLEEHEEDVDVDDVLAEDGEDFSKVESASPEKDIKEPEITDNTESVEEADKKVVKIAPPSSASERLQKRAERFNMPATADSKKALRAARFGLPGDAKSPSLGSVANSKAPVNIDQLKKRAERFGVNVSAVSVKMEEDEKLKKRKERFGVQTSASGGADVQAKKLKRAERFGMA